MRTWGQDINEHGSWPLPPDFSWPSSLSDLELETLGTVASDMAREATALLERVSYNFV